MPYKKEYNQTTVKKGGSKTPMSVMGGQGKSVSIKPMFTPSKPTGKKGFGKK
jgi:hypothetical protein